MTYDGTAMGQPNIGNGSSSGTAPPWADWGSYPGPGGFQELDLGVEATLIRKGNYNYFAKAIPASESLGGDALPNSLYLTAKPAWFGNLNWPPFNPSNPGTPAYTHIPAGYRFVNGTNPPGASTLPPIPSSTPPPAPSATPSPAPSATPSPEPSASPTPAPTSGLLINEGFEGTGKPQGWNGNGNWDSTTSALAGAQSLRMVNQVASNEVSLNTPEAWIKFEFRFSTLPAAGDLFFSLSNANFEELVTLRLMPNGQIIIDDASGKLYDATTQSIAPGVKYFGWIHYKAGTGSKGTCEFYFSTTDSRPDFGDPKTAGTSNSARGATNAAKIFFEYSGTMDVDNLQAAATEPSSSGSPAPVPTPPTENPTPSGLVAAYDFNESSGTSALDASGNGNTGTITGATRTSGKFGSALNFDGKKDLVRINASASLNVSSELTLEAWVNPAAAQGGWRTILQREIVAYWLHASHDSGNLLPATGGTFNGGSFGFRRLLRYR